MLTYVSINIDDVTKLTVLKVKDPTSTSLKIFANSIEIRTTMLT